MLELNFVSVINNNSLFRSVNILYCTEPVQLPSDADIIKFASAQLEKSPDSLVLYLYEKQPFDAQESSRLLSSLTLTETLEETDVYYQHLYKSSNPNRLKTTIIKPCTLEHIKKYTEAPHKEITETKQIYLDKVKPYIDQIPAKRNQWIYDVLSKDSGELVFVKDKGISVFADSKWDRKNMDNLYLLAIFEDKSLKSIRDLSGTQLVLLKESKLVIEKVLKSLNVGLDDCRLLFHYQPSYYHLHIHVVSNKIKGLSGTVVGQCQLLDDVIDNIELKSDYYQEKTLRYHLNVLHPLYEAIHK